MGLGSTLASEAKGLAGIIEKAILVFPDHVDSVSLEENPESGVSQISNLTGKGQVGATTQLLNMKAAGATTLSGNALTVSNVTSALGQIGSDTTSLEKALASGSIQGKKLTVQFNPSTLQIIGRGGGRAPVSNYGSVGSNQPGKIEYRALDPYINVYFTLIFDALNNPDAFMEERFTLGPTTLAKNAATAVRGKEYTVKPMMEGFLAALRDEDHRTMIFQWGKLRYAGVLNAVSGKYTMFNTAGNPIRAEVQLGMLMGGAPAGSLDGASYLDYWKERYHSIVAKHATGKDGSVTAMTTGNVKNQFQNLINL